MADYEVHELSDTSWEAEVERSGRPVVVMFYSPACPHCAAMEPHFQALASEFGAQVSFARVNVMQNPWTGERYGIRGTPTFKFFCNGKPVQDLVGAVYPALLKKRIEEVLIYGEECAEHSTEVDYEITGYA